MLSRPTSARFAAAMLLLLTGADHAASEDTGTTAVRRELEALRRELQALHERVERQQQLIDHLTQERAAAAPAPAPSPASTPPPIAWSPAQPVSLVRGG